MLGPFSEMGAVFNGLAMNSRCRLLAGSGRNGKKYRFLIKFLLKGSEFDCPGWPGAAGIEKSINFYLNSFQKVTIMITQAGREQP